MDAQVNHSDPIPPEARSKKQTPYDYIIVGSGAGGAPLACRLARAGMKVLVLEAGGDSGAPLPKPGEELKEQREAQNKHIILHCPGLHAAATEPHLYTADKSAHTSWGFDVQHYGAPPERPSYYYPRASALGGCTAHHAMIALYGADNDWDTIANLTGDESWRSSNMRAIYERIERDNTSVVIGRITHYWHWLLNKINPCRHSEGERDDSGWLDIKITDPKEALSDARLMRIIVQTAVDEEHLGNLRTLWRWAKSFLNGTLLADLDPNDPRTMRQSPEGIALIPTAIDKDGARRGPREHLLETRREFPAATESMRRKAPFQGELHIAMGALVERVVFEKTQDVPRAVGVDVQFGRNLYRASATPSDAQPEGKRRIFARREIILSAGAFNTPQILMLSGIGDEEELRIKNPQGMTFDEAGGSPSFVHLPGVGHNLLDRCEVSVISEVEEEFASLKGVLFDPNVPNDSALNAWKETDRKEPRHGVYATNGAALAILKRSKKESKEEDSKEGESKKEDKTGESKTEDFRPDLFIMGFPIAFRGYYREWSKDLLSRHAAACSPDGAPPPNRKLWSWVILKAYSKNCGSVRLASDNPTDVPKISFRYFGDCLNPDTEQWHIDEKDDDLRALKEGIIFIRKLNCKASHLMAGGDAREAEIQPGKDKPDKSKELEDWIVRETWGHHACGTCKIGSDPWRADTKTLKEKSAVLDSKFRVHGVKGLRVVDASVFPRIPGYFIVVPIYMISEKAADTILDELSF